MFDFWCNVVGVGVDIDADAGPDVDAAGWCV